MKSFLLAFVLITGCFLSAKSQDTVKTIRSQTPHRRFYYKTTARAKKDSIFRTHNYPTVYATAGFGSTIVANGTAEAAFQGYWDLNYQYKHNLFTLREVYITTTRMPRPGDPAYNVINLPIITGNITQYALLYGWRFVDEKSRGFSFSLGVSSNNNFSYYKGNTTQRDHSWQYYAGLPFEVNYGWYARRFGPSFGFKLTGDISKYSFVGVGIDVGLGLNTRKY